MKQTGSPNHEEPNYATTFLSSWIILKKNGSIKIKLDARHLNSITDELSESWLLETSNTEC